MNSDSKHYQDKYIKLATEFWNLQQVDKTEEEVEFEKLISELQTMRLQYKDEIDRIDDENYELQKKVEEASNVFAEFQKLREEQNYLKKLQTEVSEFSNA